MKQTITKEMLNKCVNELESKFNVIYNELEAIYAELRERGQRDIADRIENLQFWHKGDSTVSILFMSQHLGFCLDDFYDLIKENERLKSEMAEYDNFVKYKEQIEAVREILNH